MALLLLYINYIVEEIESNINLFADDTCLSMAVGNPNAAGTILQSLIWYDLTHNQSHLRSMLIFIVSKIGADWFIFVDARE